jgi:hypothetical protein
MGDHRFKSILSMNGGTGCGPRKRARVNRCLRKVAEFYGFMVDRTILLGGLEQFYFSINWEFHHSN